MPALLLPWSSLHLTAMRLFPLNKDRDDADDGGGDIDQRQVEVFPVPIPVINSTHQCKSGEK